MNTVTLYINDQLVEAPQGQSILAAAADNGIEIPHFCYHPGLCIAGNCRMCLVEIEKIPKLQISCATPVREGMKVYTESERVVKARRGVLEFLLINHPVDCPICDQAGECSLQNYYQKYGLYRSRFKEKKVHKAKVIRLGSKVMLDQERCVLCTRCLRIMRDVAKDEQIGVIHRGDKSRIVTLTGEPLNSIYAGNVFDYCPVGALTSEDFRFKCRVWFLTQTPSVCPCCATGCNIFIDHHQNKVHRIRPRLNPQVNRFWMCDIGRYHYKTLYDESRLTRAKKKIGGQFKELPYHNAILDLSETLKKIKDKYDSEEIGFIAAASLSNEDAIVLSHFAKEVIESDNIVLHAASADESGTDGVLLHNDRNPNSRGCRENGLTAKRSITNVNAMLSAVRQGGIKALFVFDFDLFDDSSQEKGILLALETLDFLVHFGSKQSRMHQFADYFMPIALWAERSGSYTNAQGMVQQFQKAVEPPSQVYPLYQVLQSIADAMGVSIPDGDSRELFSLVYNPQTSPTSVVDEPTRS